MALSPTTFLLRIERRLRRSAPLDWFFSRLRDRVASVLFWLAVGRRRALRARLGECRSTDELVVLCAEMFHPFQIRSEVVKLLDLLAMDHPRIVAEIGTAYGGTTVLLQNALPEVEHMIGIDLFVRGKDRLRYFCRTGQQAHFLDRSSSAASTIAAVGELLGGRKLDVLFIDGDHSYTGVRADFLGYRQFVRDGGKIVFHDICQDFGTRYGQNTGTYTGQVPSFWAKIKPCYPATEIVENPAQDGYGLGIIQYSPRVTLPADL